MSGWWFGTFGLFFHILGIIIPTDELIFFIPTDELIFFIPTDELIFFRGIETTNKCGFSCFLTNQDADFSHEKMDSIGSQLDLSDIHVEGVLIFCHEDSTARFCGKILSIQ